MPSPWVMYPIRASVGRDGIRSPSTSAWPAVARVMPVSSRISVVLPEPLGPSSP